MRLFGTHLPPRLLIPKISAWLKGRWTQMAENPTVARKCEPIDAPHTRRGPSPCACAFASARLDKGQVFRHPQPHLQVCVEGNQIGSGLACRRTTDSHPSRQFPTLQFKICPPLSEFTNVQ